MKFTAVILMFFISFVFSGIFVNQRICLERLEKKKLQLEKQALSTRFVAESFRMTCRKRGFDSLEDWQKNCRAMFKLDYIGFSEGKDFMKLNENDSKTLFYGTWIINGKQNEVFCNCFD